MNDPKDPALVELMAQAMERNDLAAMACLMTLAGIPSSLLPDGNTILHHAAANNKLLAVCNSSSSSSS